VLPNRMLTKIKRVKRQLMMPFIRLNSWLRALIANLARVQRALPRFQLSA
jgi:hypothetical protein